MKRKTWTFEQGFAAHFICAHDCEFVRNTVVACDHAEVIVSTVGNLMVRRRTGSERHLEAIGHKRYYETYVFKGVRVCDGMYVEQSGNQIYAFTDHYEGMVPDVGNDFRANQGHEAMVRRVRRWLRTVTPEDFEKACEG